MTLLMPPSNDYPELTPELIDLIQQLQDSSKRTPAKKAKPKKAKQLTYHLGFGQRVSDLDIPVLYDGKPKLVTVSAPPSSGKTFAIVHAKESLLVCHQRAILDQTTAAHNADTTPNKPVLHAMQFEVAANSSLDDLAKYRLVNYDEAQLFSDAATYRTETCLHNYHQINSLRSRTTVALWSGTFRPEFQVFDADYSIVIHPYNPARRQVKVFSCEGADTVDQFTGETVQKSRPVTPDMIVKVIRIAFELNKPILLVFNDEKKLNIIKDKLVEFGITSSVMTSNDNKSLKKNQLYTELMKTSRLDKLGTDVVLSTCALREGINIYGACSIIAVQSAPEHLNQLFARAREPELASYFIVSGNGEYSISMNTVMVDRMMSCIDESHIKLDDDRTTNKEQDSCRRRHELGLNRKEYGINSDVDILPKLYRSKVIQHAIYNHMCSRPFYAKDTVNKFCELYQFDAEFIILDDDLKSDKWEIPEHLRVVPKATMRIILNEDILMPVAIERFQLSEIALELALAKVDKFKENYQKCCVSNQVGRWLVAWSGLTNNTLLFLSSLNDELLTTIKLKIGRQFPRTEDIKYVDFDDVAYKFWGGILGDGHTWLDEEFTTERTKVLVWLAGFEKIQREKSYRITPTDSMWWKSTDLTTAENTKLKRHKAYLIKKGISVEDFCNTNSMTTLELVALKPKQVGTLALLM